MVTRPGEDMVRKINALIRFHLKLDPAKMNMTEWVNRWRELQFALDYEARRFSTGKGEDTLEL